MTKNITCSGKNSEYAPRITYPSTLHQMHEKATYLDGQVGRLVRSKWGWLTQAYCNLTQIIYAKRFGISALGTTLMNMSQFLLASDCNINTSWN
jgi:hypothetical protein